ncbi:MAG: hypothetical protein HY461_01560 [Parcubacteria group bacterium]|nr:hypothetical protein [Parcubacteria group bacterium]
MKRTVKLLTLSVSAFFFVGVFFVMQDHKQRTPAPAVAQVQAAISTVTLNNGSTDIETDTDITSQIGALGTDTAVYQWQFAAGAFNLMAANIPGNSGAPLDYSGEAQVLSLIGNAAMTTGCQVGVCWTFDGAGDAIHSDPDSAYSQPAFTLEAWVNSDVTGASGVTPVIFSTYADGVNTEWYAVSISSANRFIFEVDPGDDEGGLDTVTGTTAIVAGQWYHVVATRDSSGNLRLYINGTQEGGTVNSGVSTTINPTIGLHLGIHEGQANTFAWDGRIDEARMYIRSLTAAQITQLYQDGNAGLGGPTAIKADETVDGDLWRLTVTPISTAGTPGAPVAATNRVGVPINLCTAGGEAGDLRLTGAETTYDLLFVTVTNCTFTIEGLHEFLSLSLGDSSGVNDSILTTSATTTSTLYSIDINLTGNLLVRSDGLIDTSGLGYLGGNSGGNAGGTGRTSGNTTTGGSTFYSGGNHIARGGLGTAGVSGSLFGSVTAPTDSGAGGGSFFAGEAGGNGGAAILIDAPTGTITVDGTMRANGGAAAGARAGGGAGGSINMSALTLAGSGTIQSLGGNGGSNAATSQGGGAGGVIAIVMTTNSFAGTVSAYGGTGGGTTPGAPGGAGTRWLHLNANTNGDLTIDNNNRVAVEASTPLPAAATAFNSLTISGDAQVSSADITTVNNAMTVNDAWFTHTSTGTLLTVGSLTLTNAANLTHGETTTSSTYRVNMSVTGAASVSADSTINVNGRGYLGGNSGSYSGSTGRTTGNSTTNGSSQRSGASHGGAGGLGTSGVVGITYGDRTSPTEPGAGGGSFTTGHVGGNGGGLVRLSVTGTLTLSGNVTANALAGSGTGSAGGGAGGAVYINAGTLTGAGTVSANGGNGGPDTADGTGGGGGGRIALTHTTYTHSGTLTVTAGAAAGVGGGSAGSAGTIYNQLHITTTSLPDSPVNTAYSQTVQRTGGTSAFTWSITAGTLPTGLSIAAATGVISGTPTTPGGYTFTVQVADSTSGGAQTTTQAFTVTITSSSSNPALRASAPQAPVALTSQAIDHQTVRYIWTDTSNDESGFRLVDAAGTILIDAIPGGAITIDETALPGNSEIAGRKIVAYNASGTATSGVFPSAITPMPPVTPTFVSQTATTITFSTSPLVLNLTVGQSALEFSLMTEMPEAAAVLTSGWIQQPTHTFKNINSLEDVSIRVRARGQEGAATDWSPYIAASELMPPVPVEPEPAPDEEDVVPEPQPEPQTPEPVNPQPEPQPDPPRQPIIPPAPATPADGPSSSQPVTLRGPQDIPSSSAPIAVTSEPQTPPTEIPAPVEEDVKPSPASLGVSPVALAVQAIQSTVSEVAKKVTQTVKEQEQPIETTLTVAAPVIIVASAPLWGSLPYLPSLLYHFITYAVALIGFRKPRKRFFGVVYDSITKEPIALAIVRAYDQTTGKLVATQVSDKQGRYEFLLNQGSYRLEVKKPQYQFPSRIVTDPVDGAYQHVYNEGQGMVMPENEEKTAETIFLIPDVPLDPVNAQQQKDLAGFGKRLWLAFQHAGHYLASPVLFLGAVLSIVVALTVGSPFNWGVAILYLVMLCLQLAVRPRKERAWGVVYDQISNAALPLATVQLIDPTYSKIVKSRLSDYQGRFSFLPDPGTYIIKANKAGYAQAAQPQAVGDRQPLTQEVSIEAADQRIVGDIAMTQAG